MPERFLQHLKRCRFIYAAFFISAIIFGGVCAARNLWPFGGASILKVDLFHQYAPFLEEFRSRIVTGKSLVYSWETGLGKDFLSQSAYYATSPLNLLYFLFPRHLISEAIAVIIMLKISLSCSSFAYYLREHFGRNDVTILIFGLLYGFCAFVTCYYWNIMWLDTVALFPLVALGAERLIKENRIVLYYASLLLTMIVNFYLAVLVCVLISLYYVVFTLSNMSLRKDFRAIARNTGRFILVSVLCAMSALVILAPVASALSNTEVSNFVFPEFKVYPGAWQLISAHFLGARASVLSRNEDMPNIYTGVLTLMLLPFFYGSKKTARKEKVFYSLLLVFMLLCSCIQPLDFLIHGFHFPANLPHRFTFVYSFILLFLAYRGLQEAEEGGKIRYSCIVACVSAAAILAYEFVLLKHVDEIDHVLSNTDIILNIGLMAVYLLIIALISRGKAVRALRIPLLGLVIFECAFTMYGNMDDTGNRDEYVAYLKDTDRAVDYMNEQQKDSFYRTEFRRFATINSGALYHYNGFSQFSSLAPGGISALMEHLGVAATGNSYRYYDPTVLIDALFDVRYVMNMDGEFPPAAMAFKYAFDKQFDSIWVYRNDRVFPLGFLADEGIVDWATTDTQPFDVQNRFIHTAAGIDKDMFTLIDPYIFTTEYMDVTENTGINDITYTLPEPGNLSKEPAVHAEFVSDKEQYVYLYVNADNAMRFIYADNTVKEDRELSAGRSLIDVGHVSPGEKIIIDFKLTRRGEFEKKYRDVGTVQLYAASYDDAVFQEAYDILNSEPLEITSFTETRIEGTVSADDSRMLFTSIPYAPGWSASLDGEEAETFGLGDGGVLGIRVPAGEHSIVLKYRSPNMIPAIFGTLAGILLFYGYCRIRSNPFRKAALRKRSPEKGRRKHSRKKRGTAR
ncbi:MAG: YfhO family protein [Blautia sp.]|nr:YfhO family protein [Blautia sp.]